MDRRYGFCFAFIDSVLDSNNITTRYYEQKKHGKKAIQRPEPLMTDDYGGTSTTSLTQTLKAYLVL